MAGGVRVMGGPRFAQYNQQPIYDDVPEDVQYAEEEIYQPQQHIQGQYQRFQPVQQPISQARQQPIAQQQVAAYDQGFQYQQVGKQQLGGQQQVDYETYDQSQYQPLVTPVKNSPAFRQQPAQKQVGQPVQSYPIKGQAQNLNSQGGQPLYAAQQQVPYKAQQIPQNYSQLPGQSASIKPGFEQPAFTYGQAGQPVRHGGQNLAAKKQPLQTSSMDMMVSQQIPHQPLKTQIPKDPRYRGQVTQGQDQEYGQDEGYGRTQNQPNLPYKEDQSGYKQPYPGQQQKAKQALNNPPNQYYQKPKPDFYANKPQGQALKQGQQQFKSEGQFQGQQDSGQKSYQSGINSQYQQQYSESYPEYPNQAVSQKQSSHKGSIHSSSQSGQPQLQQPLAENKKAQKPQLQQPQSAQKKMNALVQPQEAPFVAQQLPKAQKQQNIFDNNIMEVPNTYSEIKTPKVAQNQPSPKKQTQMHTVNEKFIDDTVENVNRKPGFNKLKKKSNSRHKKLEEYFMKVKNGEIVPDFVDEDTATDVSPGKEQQNLKKNTEGKEKTNLVSTIDPKKRPVLDFRPEEELSAEENEQYAKAGSKGLVDDVAEEDEEDEEEQEQEQTKKTPDKIDPEEEMLDSGHSSDEDSEGEEEEGQEEEDLEDEEQQLDMQKALQDSLAREKQTMIEPSPAEKLAHIPDNSTKNLSEVANLNQLEDQKAGQAQPLVSEQQNKEHREQES